MSFFNQNQFDEEEAWRIEREEQAAVQEQRLEKMSARFDQRFNNRKSFISRHQDTRQWVGWMSWIPQIISAIAAFKGARVLIEWVPIPYFDYIVGIAVLIGLEIAKRHWSDKFWDRFFATKRIHLGAFSVNAALFIISLFFSAYGFYFLVSDNSQEAKLMGTAGDPEAVALQDQLRTSKSELQAMIDDKSNYNHEGKFYYKMIPAKVAKEEQIAELTTTLREKHGIYNIANTAILSEWTIRKNFKSYTGITITIIAEIIFELMMAFCSFYDFRRWLIERRIMEKRKSKGHPLPEDAKGKHFTNGKPVATYETGQHLVEESTLPQAEVATPPPEVEERTRVRPFRGALEKPVATGSYPIATSETGTIDVRADMLIQALRNANSNLTSWDKKTDGAAKERNLARYQAIYDEAARELETHGIQVGDVLKKRTT